MALKSLDPKDKPKVAALGVLAAGLLGGVVYQFVSYPTPHAAKPAVDAAGKVADAGNTAPPAPGVLASGAAPAGTLLPAEPANFDPATLGPPAGGKDPFLPLTAAKVAAAPPPPKPAEPVVEIPKPPSDGLPIPIAKALGKKTGPVSWDASPIVPGATAPGPIAPAAVSLPPPPAPSFAVTGIVLGDRSEGDAHDVAILRSTGPSGSTLASGPATDTTERRFVSVGDRVGNGFVVAAVRADGVDLKCGERRITLKLGMGTNNRAN